MKCFNEKIYSLFLDNELNFKEKEKVIYHLKECGKCRELIEKLKLENFNIKKSFEYIYKAPDLTEKILEKIVSEETSHSRVKKFITYLLNGFFVITGIFAPYLLVKYLKSTFLFTNLFSYLINPISLIFSGFSFIIRNFVFINVEDIGKIYLINFLIAILFISYFLNYLIEKSKIKEETND